MVRKGQGQEYHYNRGLKIQINSDTYTNTYKGSQTHQLWVRGHRLDVGRRNRNERDAAYRSITAHSLDLQYDGQGINDETRHRVSLESRQTVPVHPLMPPMPHTPPPTTCRRCATAKGTGVDWPAVTTTVYRRGRDPLPSPADASHSQSIRITCMEWNGVLIHLIFLIENFDGTRLGQHNIHRLNKFNLLGQ